MRFLAFIALIAMSGLLLYSTTGLPVLFDPGSPASTHVSPRYIEKSSEETGSKNFVTAVLADYRAYDTMGEAVVILTAGLAAALIIRPFHKIEEKKEEEEESDEEESEDEDEESEDGEAN